MATEWHYGQGEEQHGPVPLEELKQLVASGQVQPTDMVWNADMPDWLPAQDVEELFPKQQPRSEPAAGQVPGRDQPSDTVPASSATVVAQAGNRLGDPLCHRDRGGFVHVFPS